jgi:hypothetical protein
MIMHFYVRPYRSKFMDRLDDILLVFMLSIFIACAHFKLEQDNTVGGSGMNESDINNFSYFVLGTMAASACFLAFFVGREVVLAQQPVPSPLVASSFALCTGSQRDSQSQIKEKRRIYERRAARSPNSRPLKNN